MLPFFFTSVILVFMDFQKLHKQFIYGINWNAFLFVVQKILSLTLTFLLYTHLSTKNFSVWANIQSIIFLLLLWLDFGLKKSIPRFAPEFLKTSNTYQFVRSIVVFKLFILIVTTPFLFFAARWSMHNAYTHDFLFLAAGFFVVEGMILVVQVVLHSYFLQKPFNLLVSYILMMQMGVNLIAIWLYKTQKQLLYMLFLIKVIGGLIIVIGSCFIIVKFIHRHPIKTTDKKDLPWNNFVKHSCVMWATGSIKSLTERNFLQPVLTIFLGPQQANIFKVANDSALFFYRMVIKTIGTTDTSLLSYVETTSDKKKLLPIAFEKLTTKVASLCVPLLGLVLALAWQRTTIYGNKECFHVFLVLTIFYLVHALLSPYERLLEVKRLYKILLYAYSPYMLILCALLTERINTLPSQSFGLLGIIIVIHFIRLITVAIIVRQARKKFKIHFPVLYSITVFGASFIITSAILALLKYLPFATLLKTRS